eukprot:CAMPEP_0185155162 /NCGR_PEP_ID=MMETSP1139-20130426/264_1 /TAXON_ID=298111 /ORGANISM="Pavlova sp., Strain CCMP459" /LENGTH=92 /DNA_ID=CAMNT_0027720049 /DNA_START=159 /DNA_END=437 /DNA_ORIENTATION=-
MRRRADERRLGSRMLMLLAGKAKWMAHEPGVNRKLCKQYSFSCAATPHVALPATHEIRGPQQCQRVGTMRPAATPTLMQQSLSSSPDTSSRF